MTAKNEKGLVLIVVLGLVMLFVLSFSYYILMSTREVISTKSQVEHVRAFYLAEAGLEKVRYDLNQDTDWTFSNDDDLNGISLYGCGTSTLPCTSMYYTVPYSANTLGGGSYTVQLKNIPGGTGVLDDEIYAKVRGTYHGKSRAIEVLLVSGRIFDNLSGNVTAAVEAQGSISVSGSADVESSEPYSTFTFESIFGMTKNELRNIVLNNFPETYYGDDPDEVPFHDDPAYGLTWVDSPEATSSVSSHGWTGNGILIVDGDMNITGGTFTGIIWITGDLSVGAGCQNITGGIFVECGATVDTSITGNADINYSLDAADQAFEYLVTSLPAMVEDWQEVDP